MFTSSLDFEALKSMVTGKDPVCGMEVEASRAAGMSDHGGKTFYFCAPACKQEFEKEPAKYAGKE